MERVYKPIRDHRKTTIRPVFKQSIICVTGAIFYAMAGLSFGSPTVIVPQLRKEGNSTAAVSEEMASWITSIVSFSAMPWTCILIIMSHNIGRKKPWLLTAVVSFVAFTFLYISQNIKHVFVCQMLLGVTLATQITVTVMVLTECASPRYRGLFLTIKSASFYTGIWVANAIGTFFNYRFIGLCGMLLSVFNFVNIFFIPETPYWLAYKGRYDDCAKAHFWLKGDDADAEKELNELIESQKERRMTMGKNESISTYCKSYVTVVRLPGFYKPVFVSLLIIIMYQMSGKFVYAVYAIEMLKKITKSKTMAYNGMLILDGFSVCGMYAGSVLTKFYKRRKLLISSSILGALLTFGMSLYLYLVKLKVLSENNYITLILLAVFSLVICAGPLVLSSCISCELYPIKSRSFCIFVVSIIGNFGLGLILKIAPYCFKAFGFHGTFLFFGSAFSVCIVLVYNFLPETKDKTLSEISAFFEKNNSSIPRPSDDETVVPLKSDQN